MRSQITKKDAILILENAFRQQELCNRLGELLKTDTCEFDVRMEILNIITGQDVGESAWTPFFEQIGNQEKDYTKKAELCYNKLLCLSKCGKSI